MNGHYSVNFVKKNEIWTGEIFSGGGVELTRQFVIVLFSLISAN